MALGTVTAYPDQESKSIVILAPVTATNSPPSGASAGIATTEISNLFNFMPSDAALLLYSTAGSGTMTATARLWGYHPSAADWFPIGTGAAATKGQINAVSTLDETGADKIRHCELLALAGLIGSRLYIEITAIGGTSTAVTAELVVRRAYPQ
jgi:hypothetical protein